MSLKAILFGSISTLADTSDLQREAFNEAFKEAGLDWHWDGDEYEELLKKPGGKKRIADYAETKGVDVDAEHLHRRKTEIFDEMMRKRGLTLRPGVADVIHWAQDHGVALGFVTSTERTNVDAMIEATDGLFDDTFRFTGDRSMVEKGKPAPDIFEEALRALGVSAEEAIAIEDTLACFKSPKAAGIPTIAFPNEHAERDGYDGALAVVGELSTKPFEQAHTVGA